MLQQSGEALGPYFFKAIKKNKMKNQFFSMIAVAAFLLTIGGTVAAKSVQAPTIWVYQDGSMEPTPAPDCDLDPQKLCAAEFYTDSNGQPDPLRPTGAVIHGERNK